MRARKSGGGSAVLPPSVLPGILNSGLHKNSGNLALGNAAKPPPEILVPQVAFAAEFDEQNRAAEEVFARRRVRVAYRIGVMIETPRACLVAGQLARSAELGRTWWGPDKFWDTRDRARGARECQTICQRIPGNQGKAE
jgi:hypothetical protein